MQISFEEEPSASSPPVTERARKERRGEEE
jgi:hypothetical protein